MTNTNKSLIAIIMGSDSDLKVMNEAGKTLDEFGILYEITVISAHRTPDYLYEYAKNAESRGFKIIIAGAGGAAHLPGMTASLSILPVIGVPIMTSHLKGLDSLLSISQMPPGVPVATVSINGAKNAGLLAVKILALHDEPLATKLKAYLSKQTEKVLEKNKKLNEIGYEKYLEEK